MVRPLPLAGCRASCSDTGTFTGEYTITQADIDAGTRSTTPPRPRPTWAMEAPRVMTSTAPTTRTTKTVDLPQNPLIEIVSTL